MSSVVLRSALLFLPLLGFEAGPARAQSRDEAAVPAAAASSPAPALQRVIIQSERAKPVELPPTESTTVIDATLIERKQASTIFEVAKDAAGVSVDGGPRATGMKFNIRGFRGNEDVLFKIDGAVKGFEKYRFGSGVFIEPELIKSITIERGPSILTGSGAVGGAVVATTKSAADLLRPGQRVGAMLKLGYNDNNAERLRMLTVFGRPTAKTDVLVSATRRDSGDFELANGQRFPASSTHIEGSLIKLGYEPLDDLKFELGRTAYTSGPTYTPFDANSSNAFVGGYVHQSIDDETVTLRFSYEPPVPWLKLRGSIAHETTALDNLMLTGPNESTFTVPCTTTPCVWNALGGPTGSMTDRWHYDIWTAEVFNDSRFRLGEVQGVLTLGAQAVRNRRDLRRLTENPLMNGADGKYPGGFDAQQPPGLKASLGAVAQLALTWRDLVVTPGVRHDSYRLEAEGQAAIDRQAVGEPIDYRFVRTNPSVGLTWRPGGGDWWLTHRWVKSFRPPLITDHFGMDAASPCSAFRTPTGTPLAPYGCGDRLHPTESLNREYTLAWTSPAGASLGSTQARLTAYRIDTSSLIGATYLAARDGVILQPFSERRRGVEFEVSHDARQWYASFSASRIKAARRNALDGRESAFTAGIPGTTLGLSLGYRLFGERLELGYRLRQVYDQLLLPGATALTETTQYCGRVTSEGVVHASNTQQDASVLWRAHPAVTVQLGLHNIFNKHWCNNGDELGNIVGLQGPGRSLRLSVTARY